MDTLPATSVASIRLIWGERWQITQDDETGIVTAVAKPKPTAIHVLVGRSADELHEKLKKAAAS